MWTYPLDVVFYGENMGKYLYNNLKAEMSRTKITQDDIAGILHITRYTFSKKMTGKNEFNLKEILEIRNTFFPELSLEYLFQKFEN